MKTISGAKAVELVKEYYEEEYFGFSFEEVLTNLKENPNFFGFEALLNEDGDMYVPDMRIFDPYNYLKSNTPMYRNPNGWTHWLMESPEAIEWEDREE